LLYGASKSKSLFSIKPRFQRSAASRCERPGGKHWDQSAKCKCPEVLKPIKLEVKAEFRIFLYWFKNRKVSRFF
jgi:hypothetical protein